MADSTVRQRSNKSSKTPSNKNSKTPNGVEDTSRVISVLDILRVLITLVVGAVAVSYYTTSGDSLIYGYKPWFFNPAELKAWYEGPIELTVQQLSRYDGSDPTLPIYLAVNGTIYDVSKGRRMYGPGGGYNVFAGRDASRAFVTGCFQEDTTHDLRGAERAYLPIEDVPNEKITKEAKKLRAKQELKEAKQKVIDEINKWDSFFRGSDKYPEVGKVKGLKQPTGPPPPLCSYAQKGRPKRSKQLEHQAAAEAEAASAE